MAQKKYHFHKLFEDEIVSRVSQLERGHSTLSLFWEEKNTAVQVSRFERSQNLIVCDGEIECQDNQQVVGVFKVGQIPYLFQATLVRRDCKIHLFYSQDSFFKCDKRGQERLLTYPHRKVVLHLRKRKTEQESKENEKENVLTFDRFQRKKTERLALRPLLGVNGQVLAQNNMIVRVHDLSAESLSFLAKFEEYSSLGSWDNVIEAVLIFENQEYSLNEIEEIYCVDQIAGVGQAVQKRVGIHFAKNNEIVKTIERYIDEETELINEERYQTILECYENLTT